MLPINSVIFKKLLEFKKQGFTYLTSADTGNYTGYDTALADCYEIGDGNEPSYGDWINQEKNRGSFETQKFVTFHSYLLVFGEFTSRDDFETEAITLEYDQEEMKMYYRTFFGNPYIENGPQKGIGLKDDFNARYIDLIAFAIWNLDFENETQHIDSVEKFNLYYNNEKYFYFNGGNASYSDFITVFVKEELWNDISFLENILNLPNNSTASVIKMFLSENFIKTNLEFYNKYFPE
jgi:hypothetical protein